MEFKVEIILDPIKVIVQSEFQNAQMVVTQHQYSNQRIIFKYVKINQILLYALIVGNADFIRINNLLNSFLFWFKVYTLYGLRMPQMTKDRHGRGSSSISNVINCSDKIQIDTLCDLYGISYIVTVDLLRCNKFNSATKQ